MRTNADGLRHECGVFGIYSDDPIEAAFLTYLGLYALQHRGEESVGMAVSDGRRVTLHKGLGLVAKVFDDAVLNSLPGRLAIGHVRYGDADTSHVVNAQPLMVSSHLGQIALANNGSLTNGRALRRELQLSGSVFQTTTDSEVILSLIARSTSDNLTEAVLEAIRRLKGAFSAVAMSNRKLIAWRDPMGIRPLSLGKLGSAWVVASESCAFETIGAKLLRDIEPGELVIIDESGLRSVRALPHEREALCVFEFIYFARPDSELVGRNVHLVRKAIGRRLAQEAPVQADLVIAAPDSANSAALGYAEAAGIPFEMGLIRNRYIGRTFIQPTPALRRLGVKIKLNPVRHILEGQRVVLVDDSIVRGTTSAAVVRMLREAGAREVHMRVAAPPFTHPCHYGVDVPTSKELVASDRTVEEVRRVIGADSLQYLSFDGLFEAVGRGRVHLCTGCFSGEYPVPITELNHEED